MLSVWHYDIKIPQSIKCSFVQQINHAKPHAAVNAEVLVMSTRFLKEHIEIK